MNCVETANGAVLTLELAEDLQRCLAASDTDLEAGVLRELTELADQLGTPPPARIDVTPARSQRALRLTVGERIVPFSLGILRRAWIACTPPELHDLPLIDGKSANGIPDNWLRRFASGDGTASIAECASTVAIYVARLASDALALHPSPLLSNEAAAAYLDPVRALFTPDEAREVLVELLELGVSLRDREPIARLALSCRAAGASLDTVAEELFTRFASRTIQVRVSPEWLEQAAVGPDAATSLLLSKKGTPAGLRSIGHAVERRLASLGVTRPVAISTAEDLEPGLMRIQVNDRIGPPVPVARPGEVAVQVPPTSLSADAPSGRLLIDAASGHQLVALPERDAEAVRDYGPLSAEAFLLVAIVREVVPLANRLIDIEDVGCDLADVALSHPDLVHGALRLQSRARLTRVFRGLLSEQVSMRDVWTILNALVRYDSITLPDPGRRLFDNRVAVSHPELSAGEAPICDLVSFVRLQMNGPLVSDGGQQGPTASVDVYTIDAGLEIALRRRMDDDAWTDHDDDELRRSVGHALGRHGAPADAVLLVPAGVRVAAHDALAAEFPSLRVLARTELPPEASVTVHQVLTPAG